MDTKNPTIELAIERLLREIELQTPGSDEYSSMLKNLKELVETENIRKKLKPSPDVIVSVIGNLAGILLVLNFEKLNVISTKAISMVFRRN